MNKIIFFPAILILFTASLYTQSTDSIKNETSFSRKNKWALQFQAGYNFSIQAFNGMSISLKYHFSDKSALRFGVGYYGEIRNENDKHVDIFENTSLNFEYYDYRLNSVCNFIYYINPNSRFNLFWGLGPEGRYSYHYDEFPDYKNSDYTDKECSNSWAIGLNAVLGVEWMPVPEFSLFAEYEASGLYGRSHYTNMVTIQNHYTEKDERSYEEWTFEGNRALLGISVYFDKLF